MKEKDWNHIAKVEKAIAKKYGAEAVQDPKSGWDEKKEKDYIAQLKELAAKEDVYDEQSEKVEINGFLVPKKLLNREGKKKCSTCGNICLKINDDVSMVKYECCYKCYIQYVEGRQTRWLSGWRPKTGDD
jgi:hypothetical protein